jgi:hypothetical protein
MRVGWRSGGLRTFARMWISDLAILNFARDGREGEIG